MISFMCCQQSERSESKSKSRRQLEFVEWYQLRGVIYSTTHLKWIIDFQLKHNILSHSVKSKHANTFSPIFLEHFIPQQCSIYRIIANLLAMNVLKCVKSSTYAANINRICMNTKQRIKHFKFIFLGSRHACLYRLCECVILALKMIQIKFQVI